MNKISTHLKCLFAALSIGAFINSKSVAQNSDPGVLGKISIASPDAAALGKYIDIPVNNHTGIPQIEVPVYTVQEGPVTLSIGLSYHASGLKLDELSGWVGAGWSLQAGGVITRTVRGTPDECGVAEFEKNEKGHLGHNGYNNYLFTNNHEGSPLPDKEAAWFNDITNGVKDGEPDLFFFNFNGHSGKFYFNDDGRPVLVPESDYKIEYVYDHPGTGPIGIRKFIITTSDGTKYYFGRTDDPNDVDPVEKMHNYYTDGSGYLVNGTNNTIASWYLNKVQSADNIFSISLSYTAEKYSYRTVSGVNAVSGDFQYTGTSNWKYYDHLAEGVRLNKISTTNVVATFEPGAAREDLNAWTAAGNFIDAVNTDARSLGKISITGTTQNGSALCKKYNFTYGYFLSNSEGLPGATGGVTAFTDRKRLRLDRVKEESCDGSTVIPAYSFEYFTEPVPRRLSFAQDHWGFINGKTDNLCLIPTFIEKMVSAGTFKEIAGADRDADWPAMRAGTLKKITYPTGGFTDFEFEPNTSYVSYNKYVKTPRYTLSMGYDGNTSTVNQTLSFTNNPYSVKLRNANGGGSASFNGPGLYVTAEPGQTSFAQSVPAAGNYQVSLYKTNPTYSNGTEATVYEWMPTLVQENMVVGGLRIKKVMHNEGTGDPDLVTEYNYNESGGQSSGHLYGKPVYAQFVRNDFLRDAGKSISNISLPYYCSPGGFEDCAETRGAYLISPYSTRPMETTQGNHIGYNEVKVSTPDNGYSIYRYYGSNIWDTDRSDVVKRVIETYLPPAAAAVIPNFPGAPPATDFKRGEIKYEGHFNKSDQLLKETHYLYELTENPLKTPALLTGSGTSFRGLPTFYELSTAKRTKLTVLERNYQPGGGFLENKVENYFESKNHTQATRKVETNSKGQQLETKYTYAFDFKPADCAAISDGLAAYQSDCNNCQLQYQQNRALSSHQNAYWKYWDYHILLKCKSVARITFFTVRKNYFNTGVTGSYVNCLNNTYRSANNDLKPILELQNRFINSSIEITSRKNNNFIAAIFNKHEYSSGQGLMAYPTDIEKINFSSPSSSFTPAAINGSGISKDNRYEKEASLKVENGNVAEVTEKDGIVTSYIWGYNNTLPVVKAKGVNYATLLAAYNSVNGNITLLRSQPSLKAAFVSTYIYSPGIGITSETDPRGKTVYYEYDKLNRLILIRDNDKNIIKKICYNYAGEPENCNTPTGCLDTAPDWQNTGNLRCQLDDWGNTTGYQEQEQKDMNSCSPTYNQTQWVQAGYNEDICPLAIPITATNTTELQGYLAVYKNRYTGLTYTFKIPPDAKLTVIGSLPAGIYTLVIYNPSSTPVLSFESGCSGLVAVTGSTGNFADVKVAQDDCNSIRVDD